MISYKNHLALKRAISYLHECQLGEPAEFVFSHADGKFQFDYLKTSYKVCGNPMIKLHLKQILQFKNEEKIEIEGKGIFFNTFTNYRVYKMEHIHPDYVVEHEDDGGFLFTAEIMADSITRIEQEKGIAVYYGDELNKLYEFAKKNPNLKDYVIKECVDPRMIGDYYSEVSETVIMVAPEFLCMREFNFLKRNKHGSVYYTYPFENKTSLKVGDKTIIHEARPLPQTEEERFSDQVEYYYENGNSFEGYYGD